MAARSTKKIWEVCEPHPDVFSRDPDPSLFAISLHHVMQGSASSDYTDAERFFERTFMTRALSELLERVVGRLAGQERGAPILRLETPFGGGKTHTMTALYHIARCPDALREQEAIQQLLERLGLPQLPTNVRVAVLDGRALDARGQHREDGRVTRTLWGELAYQLGGDEGYQMLADADESRTAPGGNRLTQLLRRYQPALILMDEVLEYLVKALAVKVGDSNLMQQTGAFLGELTSAVSATPQSVLVAALPASALEVSEPDPEAAERLFQHAKKVLGRVELIETPVAQDEVFGVLRRRLFKSVGDQREQRRAVDALRDYYDEYARFFPDQVRTPDYKQRMLQAYPFHPELIDLLYERWGPHPQFQRTRGALRLLALVLRRLWNQRPGSAIMLQPHHLDVADRHIRGEVVRLLDGSMDAVVTGDILQRAVDIERELGGEYVCEQLGKGAATCAFLYSISAAMRDAGATEEEIRIALLRPDINPAMVSEVLGRLRDRLWYLRYRDRRYLFSAKPNLNKLILDFENEVTSEAMEEELRQWLQKVARRGNEVFHVEVAPASPEQVPDRPQPTLVVLPLEESNPQQWMQRCIQYYREGNRVNRNMLVFLVPDPTALPALRTAVRRWLALRQVTQSASYKDMEQDDREQVRDQLKSKEDDIEVTLRQAYVDVYRPGVGGLRRMDVLLREAARTQTLCEYVAQVLNQTGELSDTIAPEYLVHTLRIPDNESVPISQVNTIFTGVPGQPILKDPQKAVQDAVRQGVQLGLFGVKIGDKVYIREDVPPEELNKPNVMLVAPTLQPQPSQEVAPPIAMRVRLRTSTQLLYPLLQAAQCLRDLPEASVVLEVEDPSGHIQQRRAELEKLAHDYGATIDWEELGEHEIR
jgi:hypothetical protein